MKDGMIRNEDLLKTIYENVKYICDKWDHLTSDFEKGFFIKSKLDKQIFEAVKESLKNNLTDAYISSELIFNVINAEDDAEIITSLEKAREEV